MICVPCPAPWVSGHPGGGVARGDIAELYRTWGPAIYRRCLRLLRDTEAARDATQEVFRKALSSPEKLADPDTALPFIYRIATNHCLNERRNAGRRGETELDDLDVASDHPDFPQRRLVGRVRALPGAAFADAPAGRGFPTLRLSGHPGRGHPAAVPVAARLVAPRAGGGSCDGAADRPAGSHI